MHVFRHFGFVIVTLVGLSLAVTCNSAAAPVKAKGTQPAKPAQITVFYPKPAYDNELVRALRSAMDVTIDGQRVGGVEVGKPLTVGLSAGPHKIKIGQGNLLGLELRDRETQINVSSGKTSYFYIYPSISGLQAGELDTATAQAELSGIAPNKSSGTATLYLYWESHLLELGFLKSDFDFFLDGKRIGTMTSGDYIVAKVPAGRHTLTMDNGSIFSSGIRQELILGAGMTHYYYMFKKQYWEFYEMPIEQIGPRQKDFRLRQ
jgi:hypothetical protein